MLGKTLREKFAYREIDLIKKLAGGIGIGRAFLTGYAVIERGYHDRHGAL